MNARFMYAIVKLFSNASGALSIEEKSSVRILEIQEAATEDDDWNIFMLLRGQ